MRFSLRHAQNETFQRKAKRSKRNGTMTDCLSFEYPTSHPSDLRGEAIFGSSLRMYSQSVRSIRFRRLQAKGQEGWRSHHFQEQGQADIFAISANSARPFQRCFELFSCIFDRPLFRPRRQDKRASDDISGSVLNCIDADRSDQVQQVFN